jgi:hypothetical protein
MLSDIPSQATPLSCHTIILFQRAHLRINGSQQATGMPLLLHEPKLFKQTLSKNQTF